MTPKWDKTWTRIGLYDGVMRRSTWARLETIEGPMVQKDGFPEPVDYVAVELCSGREGEDAYVRVPRGNPAFDALLDVILHSIYGLPTGDDARRQR